MAYGLPEHSETYALRSTNNYEPYRLYNLDVFEYEINNPMALYGSVPYLAATNPRRTLGVLWLNPSETWVDYDISRADLGVVGKLVETEDERADRIPQINTRFISETGLIDVFFFLGPKPHDLFRQYSKLTGVTPVPPQFSLGYHQCRWNYKDEKDVREVIAKFDENEIPMDVIWLDIEHTDEKRYFTWDKEKFPEPKQMVEDVAKKGRKMVLIVDPHIKRTKNYTIYKEARKKRLSGERAWWEENSRWQLLAPGLVWLDKYEGTTEDVHIWNDMNEPSVFNGPEITMPKDLVHYDDREHREVHNMYGFYQHEATHNGISSDTSHAATAGIPFIEARVAYEWAQAGWLFQPFF
ncbi:unnamed protein product, partial [Mesorhabditis belari]|uniref:Glycoside hydrolase family 31 N-terminal domain-containing protein n=1 Tax=Mesorhabditis belari TaxID=2138241 RepID=A0AAF3FSC8_9BILA